MALVVLLNACSDNVGIAIARRPAVGGADAGPPPADDAGNPAPGSDGGDPFEVADGGPTLSASCTTVGIAGITDDFQGRAELGSRWTATPGRGAVRLVDGQLALQVPGGGIDRTSLASTERRSLRNCQVIVELVRVPDADLTIISGLSLTHDASNRLEAWVVNKEILFQGTVGGKALAFTNRDYDPLAHRWLRIRDDGQFTVYDTSPDAKTWTVMMGHVTQSFVDDLDIELYLNSNSATPGPHVALFDNLNVLP